MANFEQINFKNGEAPYLSKQNLNELQRRINEALTEIDENINSVKAENYLKSKTIFEGKIYSTETVNLDNNKYKYLLITYSVYDYENQNTAGCSNTVILNLSKTGEKNTAFQCSSVHPYNIFEEKIEESIGPNMYAGFEVDATKKTFKAIFGYNGKIQKQTSVQYYVSKIDGIF